MALLGTAAMVLSFDVAPETIAEHDDWHSHEHFRERMSLPGFLRGSRWIATAAELEYFVMYEVENLDTLKSPPYLERLSKPSSWTAKMMKHYRGMKRGFCRVTCSYGFGLGQNALLLRFSTDPKKETALREWLSWDLLPALAEKPGLVSSHLLEAAVKPELTNEQRIRGQDAGVDWVVLVTGYGASEIEELAANELAAGELERRGARDIVSGSYQIAHSISHRDAMAPNFAAV